MTTEELLEKAWAEYRLWFYEHMNDEKVPMIIAFVPLLLNKIECMAATIDNRKKGKEWP